MKATASWFIAGVLFTAVLIASTAPVSAVSATGGSVVYAGAYRIHTFTTNSMAAGDTNFAVTVGGNDEVLAVAGAALLSAAARQAVDRLASTGADWLPFYAWDRLLWQEGCG